jgi:hypothetical protein
LAHDFSGLKLRLRNDGKNCLRLISVAQRPVPLVLLDPLDSLNPVKDLLRTNIAQLMHHIGAFFWRTTKSRTHVSKLLRRHLAGGFACLVFDRSCLVLINQCNPHATPLAAFNAVTF